MADGKWLTTAAANGNEKAVTHILDRGADVNSVSPEGFRPLCIAAFWGYDNIVKILLARGADINACNRGTDWTALHCAAFQGHGKVILTLMNHKPNLSLKDNLGRTAADFASALDAVWPFFAAAGCKRTRKAELVRMQIVQKVDTTEDQIPRTDRAHFSRPGSAYILKTQSLYGNRTQHNYQQQAAFTSGDVLTASKVLPSKSQLDSPAFSVWRC